MRRRSIVGMPWHPEPAREPRHARLLFLALAIPALAYWGAIVALFLIERFALLRAALTRVTQ